MFEDAATSNREGYSISDPRIKKLIEIVQKIIGTLVVERNKAGNAINEELKAIKQKREAEAEEERKKREEAEEQTKLEREKARIASDERKKAEEERDFVKAESAEAHQRLFVLENNFTAEGENYKHAIHLSVNFAKEIRSLVCDFEDYDIDDDEMMKTIMSIDLSAAKIENLPRFVDAANFSLSSPSIQTDIVKMVREYLEAKGSGRLQYVFDISGEAVREFEFPEILMFVENLISNSIKANATVLRVEAKNIGDKCQIDFIDNGRGLDKKYINNPQAIFTLGETTTPEGFGIGAFHMKEIAEKLGGELTAIPLSPIGLAIRMVI